MLVIVNPSASMMSVACATSSSRRCTGRYDVTRSTPGARARDRAAREAAREHYDIVVSFGGDGTVNEIANALAGSRPPLTCLPGGATNVFCKMLGIPGEIIDATEHLLRIADVWRPRRIDLGPPTAALHVRQRLRLRRRVSRASTAIRAQAAPAARAVLRLAARRDRAARVRPPPAADGRPHRRRVDRAITALVQNGDASRTSATSRSPSRPAAAATGRACRLVLRGVRARDIAADRAAPACRPSVRSPATRRSARSAPSTALRCVSADGRPIPCTSTATTSATSAKRVFDIRPGALVVVA